LAILNKQQLKHLLQEFKDCLTDPWASGKIKQFGLKEGIKTYHSQAFPFPKCREETIKKDFLLSQLGI